MYNKHITQKAKSPLKAVDGPGDIIMKNTEVKKGTDGTPGTPGKKKTILYSDLPESQRAAAREYNMKKYGGRKRRTRRRKIKKRKRKTNKRKSRKKRKTRRRKRSK